MMTDQDRIISQQSMPPKTKTRELESHDQDSNNPNVNKSHSILLSKIPTSPISECKQNISDQDLDSMMNQKELHDVECSFHQNKKVKVSPIQLVCTDTSNNSSDIIIDGINVDDNGDCTCDGCSIPRCNVCSLCEQSGFLYNTCVFKTCHIHHNIEEETRNLYEIIEALKSPSTDALEVGTRVYACWRKRDTKSGWYWGVVTNKYFLKLNRNTVLAKEFFSVSFDDGDKKQRMERQDIWSEFKYKLLKEKLRLEGVLQLEQSSSIKEGKRRRGSPDVQDQTVSRTDASVTLDAGIIANTSAEKSSTGHQDMDQRRRRTTRKQSTTDYRKLVGMPSSLIQNNSNKREANISQPQPPQHMLLSTYPPKHLQAESATNDDASEASASHTFPDAEKRVSFSLTELYLLRCNTCTACRKKDCGRCASCRHNKLSTSRHRQACYFNICEKTPNVEKSQPVPGLFRGWNFYITDSGASHAIDARRRVHRSFHPSLDGLHIIAPDGKKMYRSMEDAVKACGFNKEVAREKVAQFYETLLGVRARREKVNHQLLGRGYHREWVDGVGCHREVYGVIMKCWESIFVDDSNQMLWFSVKYENTIRDVLNSTSMCQLTLPEVDDNVPEHVCWGGFISYSQKVRMAAVDQMLLKHAPFHFNWIVPTMRYRQHSDNSDFESLILTTRGYKLELEAKPSSIPNAGLGLWVRCTTASSLIALHDKFFELAAGEAVDLGCYAPTAEIDRRPEHVNLIKAFIHKWECESWCFEMGHHQRGSDIFDITDDGTGELHDTAKHNIVVYANETDGKDIPSIFAEHDPEGSVHYYMGHRDEDHGIFRLPVNGDSIELKVDYGPKYENVRVRKGYTRLSEFEAAKVQLQLEQEDLEVLREIAEYSATDLLDLVEFLENLINVSTLKFNPMLYVDKLIRILIIAMSIYERVSQILQEFARPVSSNNNVPSLLQRATNGTTLAHFCDNGYTDMKQTKLFDRSRRLVCVSIDMFQNSDTLKGIIISEFLYTSCVCKTLGVDSIDAMCAEELRRLLLEVHKSKNA